MSQGLPDTVRWAVEIAAQPAGAPVITGDALVLPLRTGHLAAHRVHDGSELWTAALAAEQPLAGDGERVYVASAEAIHALHARTGQVAWRVATGGTPTAPPLAHAGWVIAAAAGEVVALRAADGAIVWRKPVGPVEFRPALDGDLLVVAVTDGRVVALDLLSGSSRWERALGSAPGEPFAVGGRVYVGTVDKSFYTLHASSGRTESRWAVGAVPRGRAAADDRHVYFASMDNVLRAVDRGNGALRWRQGLTYRPAAGPVLLGGFVIVPGYVQSLPAFSGRDGTAAGRIGFAEALAALPVFSDRPGSGPMVLGMIGGLANRWTLTLLEPSLVPDLPIAPLTALPGELVPMPLRLDL